MHVTLRLSEQEKQLPPEDLARKVVEAVLPLCLSKGEVHVHKAPAVDGALPALTELVAAVDAAYADRVLRMLQDVAKEASK